MNDRATIREFGRGFAVALLLGAVLLALFLPGRGLASSRANDLEAPREPSPQGDERALAGYESPLVISAADFTTDGNSGSGDFFYLFAGGYLVGSNAGGFACFQAPAYLPQGAMVTSMFVSVLDDSTTGSVFVNLYRVDNFNEAPAVRMAEVTTTDQEANGAIVTLQDTSIVSPGVLYPNFSYYLGACLDDTVRLYAARIYYTE